MRQPPTRRTRLLAPWGTSIAVAAVLATAIAPVAMAAEPSPAAVPALSVVASFRPIAEAVRAVGRERIHVTDLTPPDTSPHDLEIDPRTLGVLEDADVIFLLGSGFQPNVTDAIGAMPAGPVVIDLLIGRDLIPVGPALAGTVGEADGEVLEGGWDPHVWLDPVRFAGMTATIADVLIRADPAGADQYAAGAAAFQADLAALHAAYTAALGSCRSRTIVTSHRAFGYLAQRYGLEQVPIAGLSPSEEPDPRSLAAIAALARERGVRTIFYESVVPRDFAETVAQEIGAGVDALDPVESLTEQDIDEGGGYVAAMERNLVALAGGLSCTDSPE